MNNQPTCDPSVLAEKIQVLESITQKQGKFNDSREFYEMRAKIAKFERDTFTLKVNSVILIGAVIYLLLQP